MLPLNFMPVEVRFRPAGKYWIGSCPDLDISTHGETFERVQENLMEALGLFVESCLCRGTLEEVLIRAGYTKTMAHSTARAASSYFASGLAPVDAECRA